MNDLRRMGTCKKKRGESKESANGWNYWNLPVPELLVSDMPAFKDQLYKAITTEETFMVYNGRKYCKQYARFVIQVIEQRGK